MSSKIKILLILLLLAGSVFCYWPTEKNPRPVSLGLDLQGGSELIYELEIEGEANRADAILKAKEMIEDQIERGASVTRRLAAFEVRTEGDRLVVTLPGIDLVRLGEVKKTIEEQGNLEFRFVVTDQDKKRDDDEAYQEEKTERRPKGLPPRGPYHWYRSSRGDGEEWVLVEDQRQLSDSRPLTGAHLTSIVPDHVAQEPAIHFRLNDEGAAIFGEITGPNAATSRDDRIRDGRRLAILMNEVRGKDGAIGIAPDGRPYGILRSYPEIRSKMTDGGEITGGFRGSKGDLDMDRLVAVLRRGSLPGRARLVGETTIGPLLGDDTIRKGVVAAAGGLLFVFLFVSVYYLASGWVTVFALLMNASLTLAAVSLFGETLTLPGIAGLILTVGMAVDANVLIFERIREELSAGKGTAAAMEQGYDRAMSAILDSNITTIITSIILWWQGSGPVKGFGVTLTIGLIFSLFTSVFVTRTLLRALVGAGFIKNFRMLQMVPQTNVAFSRLFRVGAIVSVLVIGLGLAHIASRGKGYLGIDFMGGDYVRVRLSEPAATESFRDRVRDLLQKKGYANTDALVVPYGDPEAKGFREFGITVPNDPAKSLDQWVGDLTAGFAAELAPEPFGPDASRRVERRASVNAKFAPGTKPEEVAAALQKRFPSIEVAPAGEAPQYADFRISTASGSIEELSREIRTGSLKDRFVSDCLYLLGGEQGRWQYSVKLKETVNDPAALEKKLVDAGYTGAKISRDPAASGRWIIEVATADLRQLEVDLVGITSLGGVFASSAMEPAGQELTINLLFHRSEDEIRARVRKIHTDFRIVSVRTAGPVQRLTVAASDDAVLSLQRARDVSELDLRKLLSQEFKKEVSTPFESKTHRGAAVAKVTKQKAVWATILSLVAIIVYVGFRFDFRSGVAAVIALLHDTLVALVALSLAGYKMDLEVVGAVLTIIGYSINDTIVIYDRLRENMKLRGRADIVGLMDLSLNQTLSRTLLTTGLTLLATVSILIWGGDEVRPFAFTLVVGMVSGTYSTVYIACPLLALWGKDVGSKSKKG